MVRGVDRRGGTMAANLAAAFNDDHVIIYADADCNLYGGNSVASIRDIAPDWSSTHPSN